MMQIMGLLGMYFDAAVVVFVTNSSLLFRLAMTNEKSEKTFSVVKIDLPMNFGIL